VYYRLYLIDDPLYSNRKCPKSPIEKGRSNDVKEYMQVKKDNFENLCYHVYFFTIYSSLMFRHRFSSCTCILLSQQIKGNNLYFSVHTLQQTNQTHLKCLHPARLEIKKERNKR